MVSTSSLRGAALIVVWSSGFIGAELGARNAGPDTVLAWRALTTALVLLPWFVAALSRLTRQEWLRQAVLALLSQFLYLGGTFWAAAEGVPAGTSALVASLQPAVVLVAVVLMSAQKFKLSHVAGLMLGSVGVGLTAAGDLQAGVTVIALFLPLGAMLALSAGTLLQQRWSSQTPLMQTLAVQAVFTAGFFTLSALITGNLAPEGTAGFWAAVIWGAVAGIGSYGLYYLVTSQDGATRASTLLYLTPAATALWAAVMFGQPIRPTTVVGMLISAGAVFLLRDTPSAREPVADSDEASSTVTTHHDHCLRP